MMQENGRTYPVDLNALEKDGTLACPYCGKGKVYLYAAKGMVSMACNRCNRMVLWDFDHQKAFKAKVRKYNS